MQIRELLSPEMIFLKQSVRNSEMAIDFLGNKLVQAGCVNARYMEAVKDREKGFPTGLQLKAGGIAIPHATPDGNVQRSALAVARFKDPVSFHAMEDPDDVVEAKLVFLLALEEASEHLALLSQLFQFFQQEKLVKGLLQASEPQSFYQLMASHIA